MSSCVTLYLICLRQSSIESEAHRFGQRGWIANPEDRSIITEVNLGHVAEVVVLRFSPLRFVLYSLEGIFYK